MDTARVVLAMLLPLALLGLLLVLTLRWRKKQIESPTPPSVRPSRARPVIFTLVVLVVTGALSGWMGGWSLESLLMPVAWLVTGFALFWLDRFLDSRTAGKRRKIVGPLPYWWVLVCMAPLGWGLGILGSAESSPLPTWALLAVMGGLVAASVAAFCLRFGLSPRS